MQTSNRSVLPASNPSQGRGERDVIAFLSQLNGAVLTRVPAGDAVPPLAALIAKVWPEAGRAQLSTVPAQSVVEARIADTGEDVDCVVEAQHGTTRRRFRLAAATTRNDDGPVRLIAISDTSEVEALEVAQTRSHAAVNAWRAANRLTNDEVLRLALQDPLTNLPNRRAFDVALRAACQSGQAILGLLDLDRFKDVNDQLGHSVGDRLLAAVAGRLAGKVRASDFVARFAGDEFAVILHGAQDEGHVQEMMERLSASFKERFDLGDLDLRTSMTIGLTRIDAGDDPAIAFRRADTALHRAKRNARGSVAMASPAHEAIGLCARDAMQVVKRLLAPDGLRAVRRPVMSPFGGTIAETIEIASSNDPTADCAALAETAASFGLGPAMIDATVAAIGDTLRTLCAPLGVHLRLPPALLREEGVVEKLACLPRAGALALEVPARALGAAELTRLADLCESHALGLVLADWDLSFGAFETATHTSVVAVKIDRQKLNAFLARRGAAPICEAAFESLHETGAAVIVRGTEAADEARLFELGVTGVEPREASGTPAGLTACADACPA